MMTSNKPPRRQRALVVDPDRRRADASVRTLDACGFAASVACSPQEALMALGKPPRIVLLDVAGPLDPTRELLRAFQRVKALRGVPIVGTRGPDPVDPEQLRTLRADGILKILDLPVHEVELREVLSGPPNDSLPPLLPESRGERPRMIAPPPASSQRPAPGPTVGERGAPATLDFAGMTAAGTVLEASAQHLVLRSSGPVPPEGSPARLAVAFRRAVHDSMRDLPFRVLGQVEAVEASGAAWRVRVAVRVASPRENLDQLVRWLDG